MKTTDTHAHVNSWSYKEELEEVIDKMIERNVTAYNIGTTLTDSKEILDLHDNYEFLLPVIGVHPGEVDSIVEGWEQELEELIKRNPKAIGEIGLDYHYDNYDEKLQKEVFIKQIEIASQHNLPIVVHTRDSLEDCYEIIKNYPNQKFLLHSWSGDVEMTEKYRSISNNIYFSYNGILTFKNAQLQQEVIKTIPLDRLLFETDCPYLSPVPKRGKTNYPWRTKYTIEFAAQLLNIKVKELNESNNKVAKDFYN